MHQAVEKNTLIYYIIKQKTNTHNANVIYYKINNPIFIPIFY